METEGIVTRILLNQEQSRIFLSVFIDEARELVNRRNFKKQESTPVEQTEEEDAS